MFLANISDRIVRMTSYWSGDVEGIILLKVGLFALLEELGMLASWRIEL